MANPILRVDLTEGARDFQSTATEPGLPLLDRQNTNYEILHRWLGDLIAEPEWQGAHVAFYLRDKPRGRLENVQCYPASKEDLEGPLKADLEELGNRLKKARPGSSTEQLLHRIARQTFTGLSADLTQSDFDSYFFKCRSGRDPYRLVWCWGYQRTDQQPAPAYICTDSECQHLFVRRPGDKSRCPVCEQVVDPRRRKAGMAGVAGRRMGVASLLLLLLLLGAFLWFNRPQLIVTPTEWAGPQGSQMKFSVTDKRWYFFEDDVTSQVIAQSLDPRVVSFQRHAPTASANRQGETTLTFLHKDRATTVAARVGPPENPASLVVRPENLAVTVGGTRAVSVIGKYPNGQEADLTAAATYASADSDTAFVYNGRIEGIEAGATTIAVRYQAPDSSGYVEQVVPVTVKAVEFTGLEIALDPASLASDQSGRIEVVGVDADGERHDLIESSQLELTLTTADGEPASERAVIDGEYLVAHSAGEVVLRASFGEWTEELQVDISGDSLLPEGTFLVSPAEVDMKVGELFALNVVSAGSEPLEITSSDESIVYAWEEGELSGGGAGEAEVTVKQGSASQVVQVTVSDAEYASLRIEPRDIDVRLGDVAALTIYGTTTDGEKVRLSPRSLAWIQQPLSEYADFNRETLEIVGLRRTSEPQNVQVMYGDNEELTARATFEVVGAAGSLIVADDEFLSHPPIGLPGRTVVRAPIDLGTGYGGNVFTSDSGLVVRDFGDDTMWARANIAPGSTIIGADGFLFDGVSDGDLRRYLLENPLGPHSRLLVRGPDGVERLVELGQIGRVVQDVEVAKVTPVNVTPDAFDAGLVVSVRLAGDYRVLSAAREPLTDFTTIPAGGSATFELTGIPRSADDEHQILVERRIGDTLLPYPLTFKLESQ